MLHETNDADSVTSLWSRASSSAVQFAKDFVCCCRLIRVGARVDDSINVMLLLYVNHLKKSYAFKKF